MTPPTPQQLRVINKIAHLTAEAGGAPPTVRELALALGYAHPAGIHGRLVKMRSRGLVQWEPRQARTLRVVGAEISRSDLARLDDDQLRRIASWCAALLAERLAP